MMDIINDHCSIIGYIMYNKPEIMMLKKHYFIQINIPAVIKVTAAEERG